MAGGGLLIGHFVLHFMGEGLLWAVFDWAGASLLVAATVLNMIVMRRWIVAQRDGFYAAVASG